MSIINHLKNIIINFFLILIIVIFINTNFVKANEIKENKIIYKIFNKSYTLIDLYNRIEYLKLVSEENSNIDNNFAKNDLKSVIIFNEYFLKYNDDLNALNIEAERIYNNLINENNLNEKNTKNIKKNIIIENLKFDIVRKQIIEDLLNKKRNEIFSKKNNDDDEILYNYNIKYLNVNKIDIDNVNNNIGEIKIENINQIEEFLINNNINYFVKNDQIENLNNINNKIKKKNK